MSSAVDAARVPFRSALIDRRVVFICFCAVGLAVVTGFVAQLLVRLIGLVTNLAFYGRFSTAFVSPAGNRLGYGVVLVPLAGGILVGLLARYGSRAIRGHGIPEAMEQVLLNESRIPARVMLLKPLSAAIAIGTGGPFGAEGPIIATGGAMGSVLGQLIKTTGMERKTLLAAGAAAGMAATFGSPVSAVLLAVELLLFEYRPRSVVPVALASVIATGVRYALVGSDPVFPMPHLERPTYLALVLYILLGAVIGLAAVLVTRAVYGVEDLFEKLPIHWMWWPAIGGLVVGLIGIFAPRTMGVGYDNIEQIVAGSMFGPALMFLAAMKFVSWVVDLGSGTSGGTLAPLFTIGGGAGSLLGTALLAIAPACGVDIRMCALVGMAAIFAGASRALLASVIFAFETTLQPMGLLPLLGGCSAAYLISSLFMENTIMTEKLARRGVRVPAEYAADFLDQLLVANHCSRHVDTLDGEMTVGDTREWFISGKPGSSHQGYPVVDAEGHLLGVITRRNVLDFSNPESIRLRDLIARPPAVALETSTLREAADHMVREGVGRLAVVSESDPRRVVGIISRSDLLHAHHRRLAQS